MKPKIHNSLGALGIVLFALVMGLVGPADSSAQAESAMGTPARTFDWSDYRGAARYRLFLMKLTSFTLSSSDVEIPFKQREPANRDVQFVRDLTGTLNIDRLGLRIHFEDRLVPGRRESDTSSQPSLYPELDLSAVRFGADLDIYRCPFAKAGINCDYQLSTFTFEKTNYYGVQQVVKTTYSTEKPLTVGIHGQCIPFRIKEVPVTFQARVRCPVPYLEQLCRAIGWTKVEKMAEVKVLDWEVSGAMRPSIWSTSHFGHSTFSACVEAGFRSFTLNAPLTPSFAKLAPVNFHYKEFPGNTGKVDMRAQWQGVFFQVSLVF